MFCSKFESFVNSERCKTVELSEEWDYRLRALLIRKDVKLYSRVNLSESRLRALLIRKDVKRIVIVRILAVGLRALLIRKDVKLCKPFKT